MASIATAIESYMVDNNSYPLYGRIVTGTLALEYPATVNDMYEPQEYVSRGLTTPVAYLTSIPQDSFATQYKTPLPYIREYNYLNLTQHIGNMGANPAAWVGQLKTKMGRMEDGSLWS